MFSDETLKGVLEVRNWWVLGLVGLNIKSSKRMVRHIKLYCEIKFKIE